jgi:AcrR family transcriptional regulator
VTDAGATGKGAATAGQRLRQDDGRLVRGRKSRERIQQAARELFREHGFDGATLRAIAERAGMGASSIYRHVRTKEELLVYELTVLQDRAWKYFRQRDDRKRPTLERVAHFLEIQHRLLANDRDFTSIALRGLTRPDARVAGQVLQLQDQTIGLLAEILQIGRMKKDLARDLDVLEAARTLFHITQGARLPWLNGVMSDEECLLAIQRDVSLLFRGIGAEPRSG